MEEVKSLLNENALKTISLPFKDGALLKFSLPKISEVLHEFDNFAIAYDIKSEYVDKWVEYKS
jgi:hypothetical protein